jgi:hypothetical protein
MKTAEALRQAAAEGLTLERSDSATGFRGVKRNPARPGRRFQAKIGDGSGSQTHLGMFDTAEEAALACARARGPQEEVHLEAAAAEAVRQAAEAVRQAAPCHAMPCHAMPCHAMLCHAML